MKEVWATMNNKVPIRGKIASVEDEFTVLINKGEVDGVELGMVFAITSNTQGAAVIDPVTGDHLGNRPVELVQVKVTEVFDRYSVAQTYKAYSPISSLMEDMRRINPGVASSLGPGFSARDRIKSTRPESAKSGVSGPVEVVVNIGDDVKQVGTGE